MIYYDEDNTYSIDQAGCILNDSPQKHKEAGFDRGWESRFATWYQICKEFGFCYYEKMKKLEISTSGKQLIEACSGETIDQQTMQNIFANALVKYETDNPLRKNSNHNRPLILLLRLLEKMKKKDPKSSGISIKEIPYLLVWPNEDVNELYKYIIQARKEFGFSISNETVYDKCLKILHAENNTKRFKFKTLLREQPDEYIRKMRLTGLISIRGMGRFIDVNTLAQEKIDYILKITNGDYTRITKPYEFYKHMEAIDPVIMQTEQIKPVEEKVKLSKLNDLATSYDSANIYQEMINLKKSEKSDDDYFRLIDGPTRLELLTAIALKQQFPQANIVPNYRCDDEGTPMHTAPGTGDTPDITARDESANSIVEVTLMLGKAQVSNEMIPIRRHVVAEKRRLSADCFAVFIAPVIHRDVADYNEFQEFKAKKDGDEIEKIVPYSIEEFCSHLPACEHIVDMRDN